MDQSANDWLTGLGYGSSDTTIAPDSTSNASPGTNWTSLIGSLGTDAANIYGSVNKTNAATAAANAQAKNSAASSAALMAYLPFIIIGALVLGAFALLFRRK